MPNTIITNRETPVYRTRRNERFPPFYPKSTIVYSEQVGVIKVSRTPKVTLGYHNLRKLGQRIPPLAYLHVEEFASASYGLETTWYMSTVPELTMTLLGTLAQPSVVMTPVEMPTVVSIRSQCETLTINKLLLAIKDQKANLVQAYAESKQLHSLIGDTTIKLARAYGALRKGRLDEAGETLGLKLSKRSIKDYRRRFSKTKGDADLDQVLARGVLAIQYGVKPLISDVIGAELYAQKKCYEVVNTVTKIHKLRLDASQYGKTINGSQGCVYRTIRRTGTVSTEYSCTFTTARETNHTLKQMGFSNPLLLAWELLPWSFVIDWFIPIGNYISSLDATHGLVFRDGYVSTKIDCSISNDQVRTRAGAYSTYGKEGLSLAPSYERKFERRLLTAFPSARLPVFKNPFSWEHALNGIALLTALRGGSKRLGAL